jgi:hypothetical protein
MWRGGGGGGGGGGLREWVRHGKRMVDSLGLRFVFLGFEVVSAVAVRATGLGSGMGVPYRDGLFNGRVRHLRTECWNCAGSGFCCDLCERRCDW